MIKKCLRNYLYFLYHRTENFFYHLSNVNRINLCYFLFKMNGESHFNIDKNNTVKKNDNEIENDRTFTKLKELLDEKKITYKLMEVIYIFIFTILILILSA